jgi:L-proline amide hydrolase
MKRIGKFVILILISILIVIILSLVRPTWTPRIKGSVSISELSQVTINGTKHAFMIRGNDISNPIILFVHGGPSCSEIPYATKYQDQWEKDFTIVHYDQRGSGKSYHFFEDYSQLSTKVLVDDLLTVTDYISKRFRQSKIILAGHSFGTYIALQAAAQAPEKYSAYIGIGQTSDTIKSELYSLDYCLEQAQNAGNHSDVTYLESLRDGIQKGLQIAPRDYVRKYGGAARLIDENKDYLQGFLFSTEYNLLDAIRFLKGVSVTQDKLMKEVIEKPLPTLVNELEIPCYFVMGQYDNMTATKAAKEYFDVLTAPEKEFIIYPNSAHYPQFEEHQKFSDWLTDTFSKKAD